MDTFWSLAIDGDTLDVRIPHSPDFTELVGSLDVRPPSGVLTTLAFKFDKLVSTIEDMADSIRSGIMTADQSAKDELHSGQHNVPVLAYWTDSTGSQTPSNITHRTPFADHRSCFLVSDARIYKHVQ